jgi:hypothetical protein
VNKQEWITRLGKLPKNMELTSYGLIYRDPIATAPTVEGEQYNTDTRIKITLGDYTLRHLNECRELLDSDEIKAKIATWAKTQSDYRRSNQYLLARKKYEAKQLAVEAGLQPDEHGGFRDRGDHFSLSVLDVIWKPIELQKLHATGDMLTLVNQVRTRVYAKSYKFGAGERSDIYLIGRNESGTPFCHAVAQHLRTVADAVAWIWDNQPITARQGDVAITPAKKHITAGEIVADRVITDRHLISGEDLQNGALYARNAVLHHAADQHPDITIGNEWHKIVIARRSTRRPSSKD